MKKEKWILILGSNSDIAKACARNFASKNYNIFLASRDIMKCAEIANDLEVRYDIKTSYAKFDAEDFASHKAFFGSLTFFPDVTLLAFGAMFNQYDSEKDFKYSQKMINVNFSGVVSAIESLISGAPPLAKGTIVLIGSVAGDKGKKSNYIYGSTKSAVETYFEGLSHRLYETNLKTILVKPGFVKTKMTLNMDLPNLLTATPNEVALKILEAIRKDKKVIYVKSIWRVIMLLIRLTPRSIFNKTSL